MSGMAYLLLLKKLKENEERKRSRASVTKSQSDNNTSVSYKPRIPTTDEKIYKYVEDTPELKEFFSKLKEFRLDYNTKFNNGLCKEISELSHEYYQVLQGINGLVDELYSYDITVTDEESVDIGYHPVLVTTEGRGFGGYGKYSYNQSYSLGMVFNGALITPDMISNEVNPYDNQYQEWRNENPNIEDDIAKLTQAINGLELKYKKSIFKSKDKLEEIDSFKERLSVLQESKKIGDDLKSKMLVVANLSEEQKSLITKYFDEVEKCKEYGLKMRDMINYVCSRAYEINQDTYDFLVDYGLKNGVFTQEEIDRIKELMSNEILENLTEGISYSPYPLGMDINGFYKDYMLGGQDLAEGVKKL